MLQKDSKIIITGAAGFIGSCLAQFLTNNGFTNLIFVDDFSKESKKENFKNYDKNAMVDRDEYINNIAAYPAHYIIHLGARTDTTEMNYEVHRVLNLEYSKTIWKHCTKNKTRLIYASSAATYGGGEHGYNDDHAAVEKLKPLNPYGVSKQEFDQFVLATQASPPQWYGLKFFNVFGPNEYHKGRMASVIFHAYNQIKETGEMKLFRSHHPDFKNGEQMRDFVYVKDVLHVIYWLMNNTATNGIYNLGSGEARTFLDLVESVFNSLQIDENISFVDTPVDIRDKYQYFTEAKMDKLLSQGYSNSFYSLEGAIQEYVTEYLVNSKYF